MSGKILKKTAIITLTAMLYNFAGLPLAAQEDFLNTEPVNKPEIFQQKETETNQTPVINTSKDYYSHFIIEDNTFIPNKINKSTPKLNIAFLPGKILNDKKIIRLHISEDTNLNDTITLDLPDKSLYNMDNLNKNLQSTDPCKEIDPLVFEEPEISPTVNRLKTVYFLTSLSTGIGQSRHIQDAFTQGQYLDGGGVSKGEYYGYQNVVRNLMNPFSRAIKGAQADDSGNFVNFTLHPLFGFGITSYMATSGASAKETFLVALADNFLFEYIVEGTYVAPSGIDLLSTSGGCILGYLASRYIFKKPFKAFLKGTSYLKQKYNVEFDPIVEPGVVGKGMRIGSKITFTH